MVILRTLLFNALIGLGLVAITAVFYFAGLTAAYALISISVIAVLTIIFGEKLEALPLARRFLTDSSPDPAGWQKVMGAVTSREAVIPSFTIAGYLISGYVDPAAQLFSSL